jgi:hypothetical protein
LTAGVDAFDPRVLDCRSEDCNGARGVVADGGGLELATGFYEFGWVLGVWLGYWSEVNGSGGRGGGLWDER